MTVIRLLPTIYVGYSSIDNYFTSLVIVVPLTHLVEGGLNIATTGESIMGVIKRGNSKYWYIQFQYNGQTHIKSTKTTDKKLADIMESDWRKKLILQEVVGIKDRITFANILTMFGDSKKDLASHSHILLLSRRLRANFKHRQYLDEITTQDLERLKMEQQQLGYSNQTIKHLFGVIRGTWKYARRMGYQVSELEFPKMRVDKGKLRYLSFEEEKRLLKAIDPKRNVKGLPPYEQRHPLMKQEMQDMHDFLVLLLDTGARHGEICTLEWSRISLEDRTISLWRPKVKNESILFMTDRVYEILYRRSKTMETPYIFSNRSGGPKGYRPGSIRKAFQRAELPDCSAHTLRHTHASRLIQNGLNIYEVKEILGHADIKTTMRYAHIEQRTVSLKAKDVINQLNKENSKPELQLIKQL
ncbi:tyrosine recombinase XerD [mine drainage metagenome]|uniref:Tyrosine recombinase XerD n=1 Tax=mine drainage metagenome TaxID=410659 RepID=A0A1J5Q9E7_9ZZZZ